jgi:hypothetical protein
MCLRRCACSRFQYQNMVHIACGGQNEESVAFFDKIISRDVHST